MRSILLLPALLFSSPVIFCRVIVFAALLCSSALLRPAGAADWIEGARNCEDFALGVLKTVAANSGETQSKREELQAVLTAACAPPFDICNFRVCKKSELPPATALGLSAKLPWFKHGMSCNDFLTQIRTRYQGNPAGLSEKERGELKIALELACSEMFAHCNFEACTTR